jgi:arylsulfatase A-like enzyme
MPDARRAAGRAPASALTPAILIGALLGCGGSAAASRPNVLLITVDTLRPDHLGCYGYRRHTSPHIDAIARRGVVFRQAITAAGRTVQSFPSILTGVYPMVHGLRYEGQDHGILEGRVTLTRVLKENGYGSFAVTQGLNVGLHRDFDIYDPDIYLDPEGKEVYAPARNDREASAKAAGWLRRRKDERAPFFLWMRYNAPHWPYEAPAPFTEAFDPRYHGAHDFNGDEGRGARGRVIFGKTRLPEREVEHAVAHYDGEVAYADLAVGDLMKTIEEMGLLDRTLVVITSDHGESLGEHDYFFEHGAYLYDPTVRVPLVMSLPSRLPSGAVVESQVRTIDIMPTILDAAGLPAPAGLQGESLLALARGRGGQPPLLAYSESGRNFYRENPRQPIDGVAGKWRMIRSDTHKLILIPDDPEPIWELYDLRADPGETQNIWDSAPEAGEPLREALLAILGSDPRRDDREDPPLPPELRDHLRSLGYVGGGGSR